MKRIFSFLIILLISLGAMAQTRYKAVINDPDGYTNVRQGQSSNSKIVQRINEGDEFYVQKGKNNWWPVYLSKNGSMIGYMHNSRVKIIDSTTTQGTPLSAEDESAVRKVVNELMSEAVKANNACFDALKADSWKEDNSDDAIAAYCTQNIKTLVSKYKKVENAVSNGRLHNDDAEAYIEGDGNHSLMYYLLHDGDSDFCAWDEITKVLKWEIISTTTVSGGVQVKVSIYQESCYEDAKRHTYVSKLKLIKENGLWKFSDLNSYLSSEQSIINRYFKMLR